MIIKKLIFGLGKIYNHQNLFFVNLRKHDSSTLIFWQKNKKNRWFAKINVFLKNDHQKVDFRTLKIFDLKILFLENLRKRDFSNLIFWHKNKKNHWFVNKNCYCVKWSSKSWFSDWKFFRPQKSVFQKSVNTWFQHWFSDIRRRKIIDLRKETFWW